jgi:membrane protein DedA with SNARE-associated domain
VNYDTLIHWIAQFGYAALFFALWLGIVGMPIPDEVVVMTGGAVVKTGLLHSIPAFIITYLGVISGLSLGYMLGRLFGSPVLDKLRRKKNVVRHIVPYLVGINKMSFRRYMLYSYTAGLAWTSVFFVAGQYAGSHVETIGTMIYHYGIYAGLALILGILLFMFLKSRKRSNA